MQKGRPPLNDQKLIPVTVYLPRDIVEMLPRKPEDLRKFFLKFVSRERANIQFKSEVVK